MNQINVKTNQNMWTRNVYKLKKKTMIKTYSFTKNKLDVVITTYPLLISTSRHSWPSSNLGLKLGISAFSIYNILGRKFGIRVHQFGPLLLGGPSKATSLFKFYIEVVWHHQNMHIRLFKSNYFIHLILINSYQIN